MLFYMIQFNMEMSIGARTPVLLFFFLDTRLLGETKQFLRQEQKQ